MSPIGDAAYWANVYQTRGWNIVPGSPEWHAKEKRRMNQDAAYTNARSSTPDSWAYLQNILRTYGLESLYSTLKDSIVDGASEAEVVQRIRNTRAYKTRFKAIEDRRRAGLPPISETDVINYERQATALLRSRGLPKGFYDKPDDFAKWLTADIGLPELEERITTYEVAASEFAQNPAAQTLIGQLGDMYGITPNSGEFLAFMIDDKKAQSILQRQVAAGQIGVSSQRAGYGQITRTEAERLANQEIDPRAAAAGFGELTNQRELFNELPGEEQGRISREEQFGAAFGNNAAAQERIRRKAERRKAEFGAGGSFSANKSGFTGLGAASS